MRPFLMRPGSLSVSALLAASALFRHGPPEGHAGATWALCRLPLQWIPQVPCSGLLDQCHLGEHTYSIRNVLLSKPL